MRPPCRDARGARRLSAHRAATDAHLRFLTPPSPRGAGWRRSPWRCCRRGPGECTRPGLGLTDTAATAALKGFRQAMLRLPAGPPVADRVGRLRAGDRRPGGVTAQAESSSARKLQVSRRDGGLTGRAARPEVAPAALPARDRREGGVGILPAAILSVAAVMSMAMSSARRTWLASDRSVCSNAATVPLGRWCSSTRLHGRRNVRRAEDVPPAPVIPCSSSVDGTRPVL